MNHGELFTSFLIDLQRIFRTKIVPKELSYSQILAILVIPDDGIEMSELAWVMGLENSTVTRLIARLETNGFVKREKSRADKRSIIVFLKNKGLIIQKNIEKKSDLIGQEIFLNDTHIQKETVLENLSLFQWALKKTFLKR
ncbi:MAG: MarR family transcriptional regulator [Candidatus Neomarinimicrobiota bacterium]